jgi:site-specific recombinase XerD
MNTSLKKFISFTIPDYLDLCSKFYSSQSKYTLQAFESSLKRVEKIYDKKLEDLDLKFLSDVEDVITHLDKNKFSLNTKISTISSLSKCIKILDGPLMIQEKFTKKLNQLMNERIDEEKKQTKTLTETENWVEFPIMEEKVNNLVSSMLSQDIDFNKFRDYLCLSLFILETPTRLGNYMNCKVLRKTPESKEDLSKSFNYVYKGNDGFYKFIFNKYKTAKTLGSKTKKITNKNLNAILDRWFNKYNTKNTYFLIDILGKEIKQSTFTDILKSQTKILFKKSFSVNLIRHSYLTHFIKNDPTLIQKIEVASDMGQNYHINVQDLYVKYY